MLAATPAHAAASSYVALGDSYSSGTGTRSYLDDGTSCRRSVYAYPALIAAAKGYTLSLRACSGATTHDVAALQVSALRAGTAYVTVSAGGNDAGFGRVLTECAKPAWASNCRRAVDTARGIINTRLPARLTSLYSAIRARAPRARVVVVGYPRIFNGEDCNALTWFSPSDEARLNAAADLLNARMATAARAAGFRFTNPKSTFTGHAVCGSPAWLNGLSHPITDSYHPNRRGHSSGYAPLVGSTLTGAALTVTAETRRRAVAFASSLAARQRPYAAKDKAIRPERFVVPDLGSASTRAAAARAGVDLRDRASIEDADRAFDAAQNATR